MKFCTDDIFVMGRAHYTSGIPCQDYALSEIHRDGVVACALVSDGCSSGNKTDVEARLIVLETAKTIGDYVTAGDLSAHAAKSWIISQRDRRLSNTRCAMRLTKRDILATCLFVCLSDKGGFFHVEGDGVLIKKYRNGHVIMTRIDWPNSAPFYPGYREHGLADFIAFHGNDLSAPIVQSETWTMSPEGTCTADSSRAYTLKEGVEGLLFPVTDVEELELVGVCSDGMTQIDRIDWKQAVRDLIAFKSVAGSFAKRRMRRFVEDAQRAGGRGPTDDLSGAFIRIEHESERSDS